jgi:hypothetical protein
MSVNHYFLAIDGAELASLLERPEAIRELVRARISDTCFIGEMGSAIVAITAESGQDPLAFMMEGGPDEFAGSVGDAVEKSGRQQFFIDMGYGPASYYRNLFVAKVAQSLSLITVDLFTRHCDMDQLEAAHVYPGGWLHAGSKKYLVDCFDSYRSYVIKAADAGQNLLVWCA